MHSDIWWKGPPWLQHSPDIWPKRPDINYDCELPELRPTLLVMHPSEDEFGLKFSSYSRFLRVLLLKAYYCSVSCCIKLLFTGFCRNNSYCTITLSLNPDSVRTGLTTLFVHNRRRLIAGPPYIVQYSGIFRFYMANIGIFLWIV